MNGNLMKFAKAANSGNIDWMRMDFTDTTEVVVLPMFGVTSNLKLRHSR